MPEDAAESTAANNRSTTLDLQMTRIEAYAQPEEVHRKIAAANQFTDEVRLDFTHDGIEINAVDGSDVIEMFTTIGLEYDTAFEPFSVSVQTNAFLEASQFSFTSGELEITARHGEDRLSISQDYLIDYVDILDPELPRTPENDHEEHWATDLTTAVLPGLKFKGAVGAIANADSHRINLCIADDELVVEDADYDGDKEDYYRWSVDAETTGSEAVTFTAQYLGYIADGVSPEEPVEVSLKDGHPVIVESEGVKFVLAPRIEQNVEEVTA